VTRIQVAADPRRARIELEGGVLRPRLLSAGPAEVRVALVPTSALLLGGDVVTVELVVGAGASLEVVEPAGTVAYPGVPAAWHVRARLGPDARLVWEGLPFVVSEGADVERTTVLDLARGARAVVRETLVLGRAGERGGSLRLKTSIRLDGADLLVEDLDLHPDRRTAPGVLGGHRVLDQVGAYGFRPPPGSAPPRGSAPPPGSAAAPGSAPAPGARRGRLDLARPGAVERAVADETHDADLSVLLAGWAAHARAPRPCALDA
jgi:urease accessory protein